jgi:hypothetical protein
VLSYQGPRKHFTFQNYITPHQKAHNELKDCKEPVPETKKVTDFIAGISDPTLSAGLANVYGDVAKLADFTLCQQYLQTIVSSTSVHKRNQRGQEVAGVGEEDPDRNAKKRKLKAKSYPGHVWASFTEAKKEKIRGLREKAGKAGKFQKRTDKRQEKCQAAAVEKKKKKVTFPPAEQEHSEDDTSKEPPKRPARNAGEHFGRAAHGSGKAKAPII